MWGVWSLALLQPRVDPESCLHWNHSQPASGQPAWHKQGQSRALELGRSWNLALTEERKTKNPQGGISITTVGLDSLLFVLLHQFGTQLSQEVSCAIMLPSPLTVAGMGMGHCSSWAVGPALGRVNSLPH